MMELVRPAPGHLASYVAALARGFSPDNVRGLDATREELAAIEADAALFSEGLAHVELTTDDGNEASRKVIVANGGIEIECFTKPAALRGAPSVRYRIAL